jgi:VanZ family protein
MFQALLPSRLLAGAVAQRAWRVVALMLMVVVAYLALTPNPPHIPDTGWDKANHFLAFATLAACGRLGFPTGIRRMALLVAGLIAYGGAIELLQLTVEGRMAEWADLLADTLGTLPGIAIAELLQWLSGYGKPRKARAQALSR